MMVSYLFLLHFVTVSSHIFESRRRVKIGGEGVSTHKLSIKFNEIFFEVVLLQKAPFKHLKL